MSFVTMLVAIGYKINNKLFLTTELGEKNILYSKVTLNSQVASYWRPLPRRHRYAAILWETLMQQNVSDYRSWPAVLHVEPRLASAELLFIQC